MLFSRNQGVTFLAALQASCLQLRYIHTCAISEATGHYLECDMTLGLFARATTVSVLNSGNSESDLSNASFVVTFRRSKEGEDCKKSKLRLSLTRKYTAVLYRKTMLQDIKIVRCEECAQSALFRQNYGTRWPCQALFVYSGPYTSARPSVAANGLRIRYLFGL